jgi:hypothetical protein
LIAVQSRTVEAVSLLEHDLIGGRAKWIADLTEFFRNHRIGDTVFDLYARGRTRNRGLFISRFFAWTALPDYGVSLLCVDANRIGGLTSERLRKTMDDALSLVREDDLKWIWLVIFFSRELPAWAVSFVERYDRRELGLAVASLVSGQVVVSNNQVGKSIGKQLGLGKVVGRLNHGQTR